MRVIPKILVAAAAALATTMAGCGSETGADDGSGPIIYGAQIDLTGPAGFAGVGSRYGIELAIEQINENGGINGRELKLVVADSKTDPAAGALALRKLVQQNKATFVHSAASSTSTLGVAPTAEQLGVPLVSTLAADPALIDAAPENMYFASPVPHDITGRFLAKFAQEEFAPTSVAILTDAATAHSAVGREALKSAFEEANVPVVADLSVKAGDTSFGAQIRELQSSEPDVVFTLGLPVVIGEFVKDARAAGLTQQFIGDYGQVSQDMLNISGVAGDGYISVWTGAMYIDDADPAMVAFREAFDKKFPDADEGNPSYGTVQAYVDTFVIADALRRVNGELTPEAVRDALNSTDDFTAGSKPFDFAFPIGRPLSFSPEDHVGSEELTPLVIRNGTWVRYDDQ